MKEFEGVEGVMWACLGSLKQLERLASALVISDRLIRS